MQLLGQQMCEYQTNCWSCQTVSQTAQHCESSITVKITAGKPGDGGDRYHVKHTVYFTFLSLFSLLFFHFWETKMKLLNLRLKPYYSSKNKTKQRASPGCKETEFKVFSSWLCMHELLHVSTTQPHPDPMPSSAPFTNKPPSPLEKHADGLA